MSKFSKYLEKNCKDLVVSQNLKNFAKILMPEFLIFFFIIFLKKQKIGVFSEF
jgi:hypothetical protein